MTVNNETGTDKPEFNLEDALLREFESHDAGDFLQSLMPRPEPAKAAMQSLLEGLPAEQVEEVYLKTGATLRNIRQIELMYEVSKSLVLARRVGNRIAPERKRIISDHMFMLLEDCIPKLKEAMEADVRPDVLVVPLTGYRVTQDELQAGMDSEDMAQDWIFEFGLSSVTLGMAENGEGMEMTVNWPAA